MRDLHCELACRAMFIVMSDISNLARRSAKFVDESSQIHQVIGANIDVPGGYRYLRVNMARYPPYSRENTNDEWHR